MASVNAFADVIHQPVGTLIYTMLQSESVIIAPPQAISLNDDQQIPSGDSEVYQRVLSLPISLFLVIVGIVLLQLIILRYLFKRQFKKKLQIKLQALHHENAFLKHYSESLDKIICTTHMNENGSITNISQAFIQLYGFRKEALIGQPFFSIFTNVDTPDTNMNQFAGQNKWEGELILNTPSGARHWVYTMIIRIKDFHNEQCQFIAVHSDISEKKRITHFSETDSLTGIPNRRKLNEIISDEMKRSLRYKTPLALAMMDIDYFKLINDQHGHSLGDEVLVQLVNKVQKDIRQIDTFGRWGGEEFILIMPMTELADAIKVCDKLRIEIARLSFDTIDPVKVSFGVTLFRIDDTALSLFDRADKALYEAKNTGRNRVHGTQ